MTQPPAEPESDPQDSWPEPPRSAAARDPRRAPVWSYFLTPLAVLIGAAAVIATIILTDDDPEPIGPTLESLSQTVDSLAESVESLSAAAESLSESAARPAAPAEPAQPQQAREVRTLRDALDGYAAALDLDAASFGECLADSASYQAVGDQFQYGIDLGVNGTPTFFVNNKYISGAQPAAIFTEVIAAELAGSPTSIDEYSDNIQSLARLDPPGFAIVPGRPDIPGAPIEGNPDARVVIVEFSDFQCPFCQRWYFESLPEIRELVGDDVAIAFVHFPLTQLHPNAATVHVAALCAGEQGKFWEMHDLLFEQQDQWALLPNVN